MPSTTAFKYQIIVKGIDETITYPADQRGTPFNWDFYDRSTFDVRVVPKTNSIELFDAQKDADLLVKQWNRSLKLVPIENGEDEYQINIDKLFVADNENLNATPMYDYSFKHFIIDKIKSILAL